MQTRDGGMALQFEHPTLAGTAGGGWMNRLEDQPQAGLFLSYHLPPPVLYTGAACHAACARAGVGELPGCMPRPALCASAQEAPEPPPAEVDEHGALPKGEAVRVFSMDEVEKHDTRTSAWFVHKGQVCARSPAGVPKHAFLH